MSIDLRSVLRRDPNATAEIGGNSNHPDIKGYVRFYQTETGVIVAAEVNGLPSPKEICGGPVFGFHIHIGESCSGNETDSFADTMTHYNPSDCPHPYHAGDLPPLFGNNGYAVSLFLTDRFDVYEIIGKTILIHSSPDDFTTQPAGNSGTKIACGQIKRTVSFF